MSDRELDTGPELDVVIHTEIMGYPRNWPITRDPKYLYMSIDGEWIRQEPPPYSTDIAAAMQVDKPDWLWDFFETPIYLQVTLYPSREIWDKRPWDLQPAPKEIIYVKVNWDECATKAEVYALGRCRAAVMAAEAE